MEANRKKKPKTNLGAKIHCRVFKKCRATRPSKDTSLFLITISIIVRVG